MLPQGFLAERRRLVHSSRRCAQTISAAFTASVGLAAAGSMRTDAGPLSAFDCDSSGAFAPRLPAHAGGSVESLTLAGMSPPRTPPAPSACVCLKQLKTGLLAYLLQYRQRRHCTKLSATSCCIIAAAPDAPFRCGQAPTQVMPWCAVLQQAPRSWRGGRVCHQSTHSPSDSAASSPALVPAVCMARGVRPA